MVVGGGIAGLTAAYRLSQAGADVTIVEPGPLGGKLQTSVFAGRPVDEAADAFLLRVPWALALCRDLDIDGELISPVARSAEVFVDGARHPLPAGQMLGVPTDLDALAQSGLVSPAGVERARADLTLPADPADPAVSGDDVAIGPYLRRRLGEEVVDHLIDPLVGGINAGDTAGLSLAAVVAQLDAAARSGDPSLIRSCRALRARATAPAEAPIFATPIGGMARLIDGLLALMPAVEIHQGRRVTGIELTGSGGPRSSRSGARQSATAQAGGTTRRRRFDIDSPPQSGPGEARQPGAGVQVALDDGTVLDTEAVVLACPAFVSAPLLADIAPTVAATLAAIEHSSVSMATLAFDAGSLRTDPTFSGCLVPRDQGRLVTALSYATSKWAQLRNPVRDDTILRVSAGRHRDDRHLDLDDADLLEAVLADLDAVVGLGGAPTEVRVGRWVRSFPQYQPGHLDRIADAEAALADLPVTLAGAALRGVGVPACIRSGEDAAARLGATWPTPR